MKRLLLITCSLLIISCNSKAKDSLSYSSKTLNNETKINHSGKSLMENNCYICHSPTGSHDKRLAPPMEAVKRHYINEHTTKSEFIESIQNWIKNPTESNARMYGAVNRFGLMPKQTFSEDIIHEIADYMYDNEIDKPNWFDQHHKQKKNVKQ